MFAGVLKLLLCVVSAFLDACFVLLYVFVERWGLVVGGKVLLIALFLFVPFLFCLVAWLCWMAWFVWDILNCVSICELVATGSAL